MGKFKIGDRVRVAVDDLKSPMGRTGVVVERSVSPWIRFDDYNPSAYGDGMAELGILPGYADCISEDDLELVATENKQPMTTFKLEPGMYAKGDMDFIRMICKMADNGGVRADGPHDFTGAWGVWMCSGQQRGRVNSISGFGAIEITQGQFLLGLEGLIEEKKKNPDITIAGEPVDVSAHSVNVKGVRFDKDTVQKVLDVLQFKEGCFQGTNKQMIKICTLLDIAKVRYQGVDLKMEGFDSIVGMLFDSPRSMTTVYECPGDLTFEDAITNIIAAANGAEPITVGGYDAKFDHKNKAVSFGCTTATLAEVEAVMNRMNKLSVTN